MWGIMWVSWGSLMNIWAGLHDNIPDRPSTKIASVACQLPTTALKIKTVTILKCGLHSKLMSPNLGHQCIWAELHVTGGLSATLAVNRLDVVQASPGLDKHFASNVLHTYRVQTHHIMNLSKTASKISSLLAHPVTCISPANQVK